MKIPKYVLEMIEEGRMVQASRDEQLESNPIGYAFRIYRRNNGQWYKTFLEEANRVCLWAKREYADSGVIRVQTYTDKEHRKPYWKRDYHLVMITDPVAIQLEKLMKSHGK